MYITFCEESRNNFHDEHRTRIYTIRFLIFYMLFKIFDTIWQIFIIFPSKPVDFYERFIKRNFHFRIDAALKIRLTFSNETIKKSDFVHYNIK